MIDSKGEDDYDTETMMRIFILIFFIGIFWCTFRLMQSSGTKFLTGGIPPAPLNKFKPPKNSSSIWVQVYETANLEEARSIQARIQEEDMECILYEQGRKDIHGNEPKGIGIAVPKSVMGRAQGIITRMPI